MEDDNSLQLIAYGTTSDTFSTVCDPATGDIYNTHTKGIVRFYEWATDYVYLPITLRESEP
ncbi:MAG: hypothetical protein ACC700_20165 [Anaerolineales bacterium]